jgi:TfoX/Sxy family transcriptional regulator of competence genes
VAYDEGLADRVRDHLAAAPGLSEKRMFGGLAFLLDGNMTVGVHGDELIVRLSPEANEAALERPGARPFDITRRPMKGWVFVDPTALESDEALGDWIDEAVDFVRSLPPK